MDKLMAYFQGVDWTNVGIAGVILIVGIIISYFIRGLVSGAINRTGIGKRAKSTGGNIGKAIGKAVFWLAILYTLFLSLSRIGMGEYFGPVENLFDNISTVIPSLIGAGFIGFIGFIIAKVAGTAVTSVAEAAQVDNLVARTGVTENTGSSGSISSLLGKIVFVLIIVPVAIAVLEKLNMESISVPLTGMLTGFVSYVPNVIGACLILGISLFIGRFASNFIENLLSGFGFDKSVGDIMSLNADETLKSQPSKTVGYIVFLIIAVIGVSAAVNLLHIESLTNAFTMIQEFGGRLLKAAVLIAIGVFLANFIGRFMSSMMDSRIADFVKYVAMALFIFMGLSAIDTDGQIVPVAFSAFVYAATVALGVGGAIAFGLGGREWAKQVLSKTFPPSGMSKFGKK